MRNVALIFLFAGVSSVANATTARHTSLAELVRGSELVVLGTTEAREAFWDGGRIYTRSTVRIEEVWAGTKPKRDTVEVLTLGGVVGDLGQRVSGVANLPVGGRVVLFLATDDRGRYRTAGMAQGVTHVVDDDSGDPRVERRTGGLRLIGEAPTEPFPTSLSALRRAVEVLSRAD
jgi:hypothetical protein